MSRETEYKEVTYKRYTDVIKSVTCDGCGKTEKELPESWYEFSGHHSDWGNDSIDSYEYYHSCSAECYLKALVKAVEEFKRYENTAKIDRFDFNFAKAVSLLVVK